MKSLRSFKVYNRISLERDPRILGLIFIAVPLNDNMLVLVLTARIRAILARNSVHSDFFCVVLSSIWSCERKS